MKIFVACLLILFCTTGCASFGAKLKAFLGGRTDVEPQRPPPPATFSEKPYNMNGPERRYKRVTKQSLEGQAALEPSAGSLWVNEGQGAYLFSQNIMRMIGDPIGVKIEGEPKQQLTAKVETIKKLMDKLESRRQALAMRQASANGDKKDAPAAAAEGEKEGEGAERTPAAVANKPQKPSSSEDLAVKTVPTRIVERMVDGNYRIKGSQPIMIGSREYKVIVTGIVRAEDFADEGITSSQLLDPKFDIVSPRKKEN